MGSEPCCTRVPPQPRGRIDSMEPQAKSLERQRKTSCLYQTPSLAHENHLSVMLIGAAQSPDLLMHDQRLYRGSLCLLLWDRRKRCWASLGDLESMGVKSADNRHSDIIWLATTPQGRVSLPRPSLQNEIITHVLAKLPQRTLHSFDALNQTITILRSRP